MIRKYDTPFEITLTFPVGLSSLFLIFGVGLSLFPLLVFADSDAPRHIFLLGFLSPLIGIFFLWAFVAQNILKLNRIRVTDSGIERDTMFKKGLFFPYHEFSRVELITIQSNTFISFISKAKEEQDKTISSAINASMGGNASLSIPYDQLGDLDKECVLHTFQELVKNSPDMQSKENIQGINQTDEVFSNIPKAILLSLFLTTIAALLYALSLYIFQINILILPACLLWGVLHFSGKRIAKEDFSIGLKLWYCFIG